MDTWNKLYFPGLFLRPGPSMESFHFSAENDEIHAELVAVITADLLYLRGYENTSYEESCRVTYWEKRIKIGEKVDRDFITASMTAFAELKFHPTMMGENGEVVKFLMRICA